MRDKIIKDHGELARRVRELKKQGKRIVFTSGGFNFLHVGHVRIICDAKRLGDILVVGLNSDSSIKKFKGPDYPIMPQDERLEMIAALACPDFVTLFSEKRADALLRRLKPHVHAKGGDYTLETVPERDTVRAYGGEIAIVGGPKDHASSGMIDLVRKWDIRRGCKKAA